MDILTDTDYQYIFLKLHRYLYNQLTSDPPTERGGGMLLVGGELAYRLAEWRYIIYFITLWKIEDQSMG